MSRHYPSGGCIGTCEKLVISLATLATTPPENVQQLDALIAALKAYVNQNTLPAATGTNGQAVRSAPVARCAPMPNACAQTLVVDTSVLPSQEILQNSGSGVAARSTKT